MTLTALLCLLAILLCVQAEHVALYPDQSLNFQSIIPPATLFYELHGLQPNSHYEVRVSYPSSVPADVELEFVDQQSRLPVRALLNTEKIMFQTDAQGHVKGRTAQEVYVIAMHVKHSGVSIDPLAAQHAVQYNIVLETLFYGAPYGVFPLAAIAIVVLFVVFRKLIPRFHTNVIMQRRGL
eukprot:TRINITY_DN3326_c0_g1_i1.p2 TRINITY_DN3326_c0_g1~~TRINITY_DN3326_c0_g1_i1.p2  ORF type:complete len:181 (+),score=38.16 TRINITY_DN3326_c0_g1_i1:50-592(+)